MGKISILKPRLKHVIKPPCMNSAMTLTSAVKHCSVLRTSVRRTIRWRSIEALNIAWNLPPKQRQKRVQQYDGKHQPLMQKTEQVQILRSCNPSFSHVISAATITWMTLLFKSKPLTPKPLNLTLNSSFHVLFHYPYIHHIYIYIYICPICTADIPIYPV